MSNDNERWIDVRREFSLDPRLLHFGAFWLSSYPSSVRAAIKYFRERIDCNPVFYIVDNEQTLDAAARRSLAGLIGGDEDHIILTGSTTEGLALSVGMLRLMLGDEIIVTHHEHYSAFAVAESLAQRSGARLRSVPLYENYVEWTDAQIVERLIGEVTDRTRLAIVTWVHSGSGARLPLARIGAALEALNAQRDMDRQVLLAVDATHGFGALVTDLRELHCDIFASSCHKWLNGPHGTGLVHLSPAAMAHIAPMVPSFAPGPLGHFTGRGGDHEAAWERLTPGGFHAFENRWAVPAAVEFTLTIGQRTIEQRISALAGRLKVGLSGMRRIRVVTPMAAEQSAGIVCFDVEGIAPERVIEQLRARDVVASVSPYRVRFARLTPGIYNSLGDVDAVLQRLEDIVRTC